MEENIKERVYEIPLERVNIMFGNALLSKGLLDKENYDRYMKAVKNKYNKKN